MHRFGLSVAQGSCASTGRDVSAMLLASPCLPAWEKRGRAKLGARMGAGGAGHRRRAERAAPAGPAGWDGKARTEQMELSRLMGPGCGRVQTFLVITSFLLCVVFVFKALK